MSQHGIEPSISTQSKQAHIKPALCLLFLLTHIMTLFKHFIDTNSRHLVSWLVPRLWKWRLFYTTEQVVPLPFFSVSVAEYIRMEANDSLISFHALLCRVLSPHFKRSRIPQHRLRVGSRGKRPLQAGKALSIFINVYRTHFSIPFVNPSIRLSQ